VCALGDIGDGVLIGVDVNKLLSVEDSDASDASDATEFLGESELTFFTVKDVRTSLVAFFKVQCSRGWGTFLRKSKFFNLVQFYFYKLPASFHYGSPSFQ